MEFSFLGSSLTFSGTLQHFLSFRNLVLDDKSHNKSIFCYVSVVLYCFPPASPPPIHPDSSLPGPPCSLTTASTSTSTSLRAIRLCLYQLIYYCCFLLALPSLLICPLFTSPHPASRAASVPVSTGSQQQSGGEGRGKVGLAAGGGGGARQGHRSSLLAVLSLHIGLAGSLGRQQSAESLSLNGVSICSMRKLLFSIARGPFI